MPISRSFCINPLRRIARRRTYPRNACINVMSGAFFGRPSKNDLMGAQVPVLAREMVRLLAQSRSISSLQSSGHQFNPQLCSQTIPINNSGIICAADISLSLIQSRPGPDPGSRAHGTEFSAIRVFFVDLLARWKPRSYDNELHTTQPVCQVYRVLRMHAPKRGFSRYFQYYPIFLYIAYPINLVT